MNGISRRGFLSGVSGAFGAWQFGGWVGGPHASRLPRGGKARRVIQLVMAEGPSQFETFDYKPGLAAHYDKDLPDSVRNGQRITTMTSGQTRFPIAPSLFKFAQYGQNGTWVSELLPETAKIIDRLALIRTCWTDAINHDPAITFLMTGSEQPGRPSIGAWISHGLGQQNPDLPAFVVLHSTWTGRKDAQALYTRLWGTGFLPGKHQGVVFRSAGDPVLYLHNPPGIADAIRRMQLDGIRALNELQHAADGDPETATRIAQYEMGYRMQRSVPELADLSQEPEHVKQLYGPEVDTPGTFARNCLLARRLVEREVRYVQVYLRGWDQHLNLPKDLAAQCRDSDHGCAGLIRDLEQRGLLDETLVVWGGEFGRTVYCQGPLSRSNYGRDHHPRCFPVWFAGAGVKAGVVHGETDDFAYNIVRDPVHVHDLNATILHCLGIDHTKLTFRFQGRDFRLTDVGGEVVRAVV